MNRISSQQSTVLAFIAAHPGCSIADVCRYEWSGLGHAASYARVNRLIDRGLVLRDWRGGRSVLTAAG
jgi:hypothetical protein